MSQNVKDVTMSTKVKIKNYQSIKETEVTVDGFTIIIGKNNIGKSAVLRAIEGALTNQSGSDFIREGTKQTEVHFEHKDLVIDWKKGAKTSYVINGETYSALNRAVPEPILKAGFTKMEVGDHKLTPQIAPQHDPLFLLDMPGAVVTEILAALYNLNTLSKADELCQKELRGQKSMLKTREMDLTTVQGKLDSFNGFDAVKLETTELLRINADITKLQAEIAYIQDKESELTHLQDRVKALDTVHKVHVPQYDECEKTDEDLEWLIDRINQFNRLISRLSSLKPIQTFSVPEVNETLLTEVTYLENALNKLQAIQKHVDILNVANTLKIPEINDTIVKETTWLSITEDSVKKCKNRCTNIKELLEFLKKNGVSDLFNQISDMQKDSQGLLTLETDFMLTAKSAKDLRDQIRGITETLNSVNKDLGEYKSCPACGKAI